MSEAKIALPRHHLTPCWDNLIPSYIEPSDFFYDFMTITINKIRETYSCKSSKKRVIFFKLSHLRRYKSTKSTKTSYQKNLSFLLDN